MPALLLLPRCTPLQRLLQVLATVLHLICISLRSRTEDFLLCRRIPSRSDSIRRGPGVSPLRPVFPIHPPARSRLLPPSLPANEQDIPHTARSFRPQTTRWHRTARR